MKSATASSPETQEQTEASNQPAAHIARVTMLGDLLKTLTDEMKAMPDVWQKLSESKQKDLLDRITARIETAINQCVDIIAADGRPVMSVELE